MEREGIQRYLYNIWPSVYKVINGTFYFLLTTFKNLVKNSINQIRNG